MLIISTTNWTNQFGSSPLDPQTSIANFVKHLYNTNIHLPNSDTDDSLEAFTASRLINPGVHPIGVAMYIAKKDVKDAAGSFQVCASQEAGSEAAINAIYDVYQQDETEAVLLVETDNAFNSINRKAMLRISITYPLITTFIANCYMEPARLFVVGNHKIKSREGTTQGDPTAMGACALGALL